MMTENFQRQPLSIMRLHRQSGAPRDDGRGIAVGKFITDFAIEGALPREAQMMGSNGLRPQIRHGGLVI
jgi:hypothetical protein